MLFLMNLSFAYKHFLTLIHILKNKKDGNNEKKKKENNKEKGGVYVCACVRVAFPL